MCVIISFLSHEFNKILHHKKENILHIGSGMMVSLTNELREWNLILEWIYTKIWKSSFVLVKELDVVSKQVKLKKRQMNWGLKLLMDLWALLNLSENLGNKAEVDLSLSSDKQNSKISGSLVPNMVEKKW